MNYTYTSVIACLKKKAIVVYYEKMTQLKPNQVSQTVVFLINYNIIDTTY